MRTSTFALWALALPACTLEIGPLVCETNVNCPPGQVCGADRHCIDVITVKPCRTTLAATAVSATQVDLAWDDCESETEWRLERRDPDGEFALLLTLGHDTTQFSDHGLTGTTRHAYRVRGHLPTGDDEWSNEAEVTTRCTPDETRDCYSPGLSDATRHVGVCRDGTETCDSTGAWPAAGHCDGERTPQESGSTRAETCNGLDDDCDGLTDAADSELVLDTCDKTVGVCAGSRHAAAECTEGHWGACTSADHGQGFEPLESSCDGKDNDCDGETDGADADLVLAACEKTAGVCAGKLHSPSECQARGWSECTGGDYGADYEAAESKCDGRDNDCDGATDVDAGGQLSRGCPRELGVCAGGAETCVAVADSGVEAWSACSIFPGTEVCNDLDDDCDGNTDSADPKLVLSACEEQAGVCAGSHQAAAECTGGNWQACVAADYGPDFESVESRCDGKDNDCDGMTDGADANLAVAACEKTAGVCASKIHVASQCGSAGWSPCTVDEYGTDFESPETRCDGKDNDCDGGTDGGDPDLVLAACERTAGVCAGALHSAAECLATGWSDCAAADFGSQYEQTESRCDGFDNDCNGSTDEGASGTLMQACPDAKGVCTAGNETCVALADTGVELWSECSVVAGDEDCNGLDDDCDGVTDNHLAAHPCAKQFGVCAGSRNAASECSAGHWLDCADADFGTDYEAAESRCDGKDNDCDGATDAADQNLALAACEKSAGVCRGALHSRSQCLSTGWAACTADEYGSDHEVTESKCDGKDNDCDGGTDEADVELVLAPCEKTAGVCAGKTHSSAACTPAGWGTCQIADYGAEYQAMESRCDGLDNDCNGATDVGCTPDGGYPDSGRVDGGIADAGAAGDAGAPDGGSSDGGSADGGSVPPCDESDPLVYLAAPEIADDGIDQDCDGFDLAASDSTGVFVSASTGTDGAGRGSMAMPLRTVAAGIAAAAAAGKAVFVAGGTYNEMVQTTVSLFGGYEAGTWQPSPTETTTLQASPDRAVVVTSGACVAIKGFALRGGSGAGDGTGTLIVENGATASIAGNSVLGPSGTKVAAIWQRGTAVIVGNQIAGAGGFQSFGVVGQPGSTTRLYRNSISGGSGGYTNGVHNDRGNMTLVRNTISGGNAGVAAQAFVPFGSLPDGVSVLVSNVIDGGSAGNRTYAINDVNGRIVAVGNTLLAGSGPADSYPLCLSANNASSTVLVNNLIDRGTGSTAHGILTDAGSAAIWTLAGNLLWRGQNAPLFRYWDGSATRDVDDIGILNACTWNRCTVATANRVGVPTFVAAGNHHQTLGSACVDAGVNPAQYVDAATLKLARLDMDAISRPRGAAWDCGAYEYAGTPETCNGTDDDLDGVTDNGTCGANAACRNRGGVWQCACGQGFARLGGTDCVQSALADSAWPMYRHDYRHTGRSPYVGAQTPTVKWTFPVGEDIGDGSPVIGPDGTVFLAAAPASKYLTINPDGTKKGELLLGSAPSQTPALVADGTIYVQGGSYSAPSLLAFDSAYQLKWSFAGTGYQQTCSPTVAPDGTVYFQRALRVILWVLETSRSCSGPLGERVCGA